MDDDERAERPPLVTVVVGSYNHERYLDQALDAVAAQTYPHIELIVTDDASEDGSAELITAWIASNRPGTTFLRFDVNQGACRVINAVLDLAGGTYISMVSADDWMEPDRIERLVEVLEEAGDGVGLVHSGARFVDDSGRELALVKSEPGSAPSGWIYPDLLDLPVILAPTVMLRRSVFDEVGRYREDDPAEDYDMWLRICREYEVVHVPEVLTNYRIHPEQTSQTIDREDLRTYIFACLTRHLGFSADTDEIIRRRIERLRADPQAIF